MKTLTYNILAVLILASFTLSAQKQSAPDFKIPDIYENMHHLYPDYLENGKYVFIDFFSPGCPSCAPAAKIADTVYKYLGCNNEDIVFLSIDGYGTNEDVWDFKLTNAVEFPMFSGDSGGHSVHQNYEIGATPYFVLISPMPDGKIIFSNPGYNFTSAAHLLDSIDNYITINQSTCSGSDFEFFALTSETDSVRAEIFPEENRIEAKYNPNSKLDYIPFFINSSNSTVYIGGTEQISGESVIDPTAGNITYTIITEEGDPHDWLVEFSEVTDINTLNSITTMLSPNPVTDNTMLKINSPNNFMVQLSVYSVSGKVIISGIEEQLHTGNNSISVPMNKITACGVYILTIEAGGFKKSIRFVKL
ncbi:MAG: T9SS type A sorting domain-containing protein [Bacteroidota bacterium]|nr:T9SS type A sorting domain-containing protein [Bacteroidota bacterium]